MTTDPDAPPTDIPDDSWMTSPRPVPQSLDPAMRRPAPPPPAAPARKGRKPVLRPVDALAAELDDPPLAAEPGPGATGAAPPPDSATPPPRRPDRPRGEIWKDCPVRALGVNGGTSYFLDVLGQLRAIAKLEKQTIAHLFGHRIPALSWQFPQLTKDGSPRIGRFDGEMAAHTMIQACAERGLFDPEGAVRGAGAWAGDDGGLIYHTGDRLLIGAEEHPPGERGGLIYPAQAPVPPPAAAGGPDPVQAIEDEIETWRWRRPDLDPVAVLGMFGCMMLGGALEWRPNFWVTGGRATGKSRLHQFIKHLMGGERGILRAENATAASIANILRMSTLPVALDELEPGDGGSAKEKTIVELMRIASSGGRRLRSSPDQKTTETIIRSTFLASSILIPGVLKAQDRSRIIVLDLDPFPEGTPAPGALRADAWRRRGAALKRLLIDRWPTWAQRLDLWREALAAQRIDGRAADNWATILAMADMARHAHLPAADVLDGWAAKAGRHIRADLGDVGSDADDVVTWLLSQQIDPMRRGQQFTIGAWLRAAGWRPRAGRRIFGGENDYEDDRAREDHSRAANRLLAAYGLRVLGTAAEPVLFVARQPLSGLRGLFRDSDWAGGAWTQSLLRLPGARPSKASRYLEGVQTRGTEVPFHAIPGLMALDSGEEAAVETPAAPAQEGDQWA
ncbi:MAG TPA: hypothetical protein PKD10_05270 [Paracoccaceae bacterium]|nr:hypothetical protein [Paracoccaceae bacterium]HMO70103.1 hypothetical protein [Paracoccaceae bacterium]